MLGITRVGIDVAGGMILNGANGTVFANGLLVAVRGSTVVSHGSPPHSAAVMVGASATVFAQKISVCRQSDSASCGHTASGSATVFAG